MFGRTLLRAPNSRPNGRMMGREAGRGNPFPAWKSTTHSATAEKEARIQGERVGGEATGFGHLGIGRTASCGGGKDCVATLHVVASGHLARSGSLASQAGGVGIRGVLARRAASDGEITKKVNDSGGGRCSVVWRSRSGVQHVHLCPLLGRGGQPQLLPVPTLGLAFPSPPEIYGGAAVKHFFRTFSICCSGGRCERSPPSPAPHAAGESRRRACVRPPRPLAPSTRRDCGRGRKERGGGPDQLGGADGERSRPNGEERGKERQRGKKHRPENHLPDCSVRSST